MIEFTLWIQKNSEAPVLEFQISEPTIDAAMQKMEAILRGNVFKGWIRRQPIPDTWALLPPNPEEQLSKSPGRPAAGPQ